MSQMKELFRKQAKERMKPINSAKAIRMKNDELTMKITQLEGDLVLEKATHAEVRERIENNTKSNTTLKSELEREVNDHTKTSNSLTLTEAVLVDAESRMAVEVQLRKAAEHKLEIYRTATEAKLQMAKAFFMGQKELLELQVKDCVLDEQQIIMRAFEEEYGGLGEK
jgi:hypothetical protein